MDRNRLGNCTTTSLPTVPRFVLPRRLLVVCGGVLLVVFVAILVAVVFVQVLRLPRPPLLLLVTLRFRLWRFRRLRLWLFRPLGIHQLLA